MSSEQGSRLFATQEEASLRIDAFMAKYGLNRGNLADFLVERCGLSAGRTTIYRWLCGGPGNIYGSHRQLVAFALAKIEEQQAPLPRRISLRVVSQS